MAVFDTIMSRVCVSDTLRMYTYLNVSTCWAIGLTVMIVTYHICFRNTETVECIDTLQGEVHIMHMFSFVGRNG